MFEQKICIHHHLQQFYMVNELCEMLFLNPSAAVTPGVLLGEAYLALFTKTQLGRRDLVTYDFSI